MRTVGEVAERLGVSQPAVRRLAQRLGLPLVVTSGGHRRFSETQVAAMVAEVGAVPRVGGLSRVEVQMCAAVASHPLGFVSARAAARVAGVSPTAAGRALSRLVAAGLVGERDAVVVDSGRARPGRRWLLRVGEPWLRIAPSVSRTVRPAASPCMAPARVPRRFWHLFWNAEPARLRLDGDAPFIAGRMLLAHDVAAKAWALTHLPADALRAAARNRAADVRTRAMVENALLAA